jgi:hypothetical protein
MNDDKNALLLRYQEGVPSSAYLKFGDGGLNFKILERFEPL